MKTSENIDELAPALHDAQEDVEASIKRDATASGGKFSYDYTTLDTLIEHVKGPLNDNGLMFTQSNESIDGTPHLVTTIIHESGQWIKSETAMCVPENDPQEFGSAMTYARRYGLSAILGIASEQDDDGATASRSRSQSKSKSNGQPKASKDEPISDKQKGFIKGLCDDKVHPDEGLFDAEAIEDFILDKAGADDLSGLNKHQASGLIEKMQALPDETDDGEEQPPF
jgi:hypothetical protein